MYFKFSILFLLIFLSFIQFNCMPTLRSAKIQPGFSADGVYLAGIVTGSSTDNQGNDVTDTSVDLDHPLPVDFKFRYGWERKENFGFELIGGVDGQIGAYLELPGTEHFTGALALKQI